MSSANNSQVNILHSRFAKIVPSAVEAVSADLTFTKLIPYDKSREVGSDYVEAVHLNSEVGYSIIGNTTEVTSISPAGAGAVKQATVSPCITVLRSVIPWGMISRSERSEGAFVSIMKHIVKNHVLSHKRIIEVLKYVGQDSARLMGRVSYATATYRTVSLTTGAGTFATNGFGSSITFATGGINAASKYILLQPGDNAAGFWQGMNGLRIKQVDSSLAVINSGKLTGYDAYNGILQVDFTPTAASAVGSHMLCLDGQESALELVGIRKILTNTGSLFGISASTYPLWRANQKDLGSTTTSKLTLAKLTSFVADISNASGASGSFDVVVNNRTLATLTSDENALRSYDSSYSPEKYKNGARSLEFVFGDIVLKIQGSRYIFEGDAVLLNNVEDSWTCSGSSDVTMELPGLPLGKLSGNLHEQTGYAFHTFADTYVVCREPAKQGIITGINDEAST